MALLEITTRTYDRARLMKRAAGARKKRKHKKAIALYRRAHGSALAIRYAEVLLCPAAQGAEDGSEEAPRTSLHSSRSYAMR